MGVLLQQRRRLILRSLIGGCVFAAMSIYFQPSPCCSPLKPINYLMYWSGVIPLIGVFGALSTQYVGKLADQGYTTVLTWSGCTVMAVSWYFLYLGGHSLISYILGYGLINLGLAVVHSSNQNIIFRIRPDAKSRINSIYMTM